MKTPIVCENQDIFEQAQTIARSFGVEFVWANKDTGIFKDLENNILQNSAFAASQVYFEFSNSVFSLKSKDGLSLSLSFLKDRRYRRPFHSPKKELITRSCGWHLGYRNILDLTAGLAMDSIFLTQAGFNVTSLERNPWLYLMLQTAKLQAIQDDPDGIWQKLNFMLAEAEQYMQSNLNLQNAPEVIYYDPMYPSTNKSALPGKEMQIFRRLLGENEADIDLLDLAIIKCAKLVVVKRPLKAPSLHTKKNTTPTRSYLGKVVRFDVYAH